MTTLYWHDYETFGADPARDRPVQFAGLRTDLELNEMGEPLEVFCQPMPDYLPHPQACLITGITPQQAQVRGIPEPQFIERVRAELARPGTCGVGYNSLRFDDEVTRYTLYRNFHEPYEREWRNGNSRWDIIDVVRMCYALRPEGFEWPRHASGQVSFKLEHLTAANGIAHQGAHDALSDVRATIALARLLRERQRRLYDYAFGLRDKREAGRILDIAAGQPLLHISSRYPAAQGCAALVLPLAPHPQNRNAVIIYDLSQDPADLLACDAEAVLARLYTRQQDLPAGQQRIALKLLHLNRSPMVVTSKVLGSPGFERLGIDPSLCQSHADRLLASQTLGDKLRAVYSTPPPTDPDPECQLYAGFIGDADRALLPQLRSAQPEQLARFGERLRDERLKNLLFRYRARHYPHTLTQGEQLRWRDWCRERLGDGPLANGLGLKQYRAMLDKLFDDPALTAVQRGILAELRTYGSDLEVRHGGIDTLGQ